MADIKLTLEGKVGLRCDEVFLEDSAVRFLKDSFLKRDCRCAHFEYIFVNLDDPNINLKRLMTTIKFVCGDHKKDVLVFGCSYNSEAKTLASKNGVRFVMLPTDDTKLKQILLQ